MGIECFEVEGFLDDAAVVRYGFFGRQGGVSEGLYNSLNCGAGSDDGVLQVVENKESVREEIGASHLVTLHQVHSKRCVVVDAPIDGAPPEADAMVTDKAGIALGVLTADCAPVLFYGEKADGAPVVGAAHAGWGGAFRGVLGETVAQMTALGAEVLSIRAAVGPCIAQSSYEVSDAFAVPFVEEDEANERFFVAGEKDGHLMFDLPAYCGFKLSKAGVMQVSMQGMDTYAQEDRFFSYRRATHRDEPDYGRQISVIAIDG